MQVQVCVAPLSRVSISDLAEIERYMIGSPPKHKPKPKTSRKRKHAQPPPTTLLPRSTPVVEVCAMQTHPVNPLGLTDSLHIT